MADRDCLVCGEGILIEIESVGKRVYRSVNGYILFLYWKCDKCGYESTSSVQTKENKRAMDSFKKDVDILLKK